MIQKLVLEWLFWGPEYATNEFRVGNMLQSTTRVCTDAVDDIQSCSFTCTEGGKTVLWLWVQAELEALEQRQYLAVMSVRSGAPMTPGDLCRGPVTQSNNQ